MNITVTNIYHVYPSQRQFEAESVLDAWVRLRSMMSGPNQTTFELHRLVKVSGPPVLTTPGSSFSGRFDHQVVGVWICVAVGQTDFGLNGEIPGGAVVRVPPDSPDMRIQHEIGSGHEPLKALESYSTDPAFIRKSILRGLEKHDASLLANTEHPVWVTFSLNQCAQDNFESVLISTTRENWLTTLASLGE